ncbi:MAG TPA: ATP-binding protein [Opitutaceae bacterium]|nr:ATP-binding protein [Opitutaceae bacterium]
MKESASIVVPFSPAAENAVTRDVLAGWLQELAPSGIFTTDADLVIRSWNQWLVAHSGLAAEAVIGRPLREVFPDLIERRLDEHFVRALHGEISVLSTALHKYLLPFRGEAGGRMLQTARIAPLPDGHRIVGTITIIEDVTQRVGHAVILRRQHAHDRLLSEALELLLASEEPMTIAAQLFPRIAGPLKLDMFFNYVLAPDGRRLELNSAAGITAEVRKATATLELGEGFCGQVAVHRAPLVEARTHLDQRPVAEPARRLGLRAYAGFPLVIGDRLLGTLSFGTYEREEIDPDEIDVLAKLAQYVAIALDRADRDRTLREARQRLSAHAEELETRIAERTAKLHETILQLESFSYTIAHDLRAPIRSLTGFTEILLHDHAADVPEDAQALLRRLSRASHRLDALTRDLLKFSRLSRQDVKLAPVELTELVEDIVAVTPALQGGVLTIEPPLGVVFAQRTLLQQCISNLFDNALKFAKPGVRPSILIRSELRPTAARGVTVLPGVLVRDAALGEASADARRRIWIEDNGIGIPPQAHEKIFGIFERIPGPVPIEGTGIGLAIVARAAEQMGGACGVESTPDEGSRFWLEFAPADKPAGVSS